MKGLKALLLLILLASCFAVGLFGAPLIRTAYAKVFPEPAYSTGDFKSLYASAGHPVVLFSTSTCPYCKKAREMLNKRGIMYTDYVTDKSKDAEAKFNHFNGKAVPLIFIGNRKILGFNKAVIESAIDQLARKKDISKTQKT